MWLWGWMYPGSPLCHNLVAVVGTHIISELTAESTHACAGEDWHVAAEHGITMIERVDSALRAGDAAKKEKLKGEIKDLLDPIEVIMSKGVDNVTKMRQERDRERGGGGGGERERLEIERKRTIRGK